MTTPNRSSRKLLAVAIAVIIVAASLTVVIAYANERSSSVITLPTTSSFTSPSSSAVATTSGTINTSSLTTTVAGVPTMTVNGSVYYSDDISNDITVGFPGYSYFHNTSVTFLGVEFETYCPPNYGGCPVPPGVTETTVTAVMIGVMRLNATFPDKSTEFISALIGDDDYIFAFAHHNNLQAGFLVVYSSSGSSGAFKVYLLVSNTLQLHLSLNASGAEVSITADDFNTLATTNNVTAANEWLVSLGYYDGPPCWTDSYTVGLAITEGHYASSNITAAKFLDLINPAVTYSCTLYLGYGTPVGFVFQPLSDMAAGYGCIGTSPCLSGTASIQVTVTGYWNQGGSFMNFPRGTYTVLAEDEWGDATFAYFTIS